MDEDYDEESTWGRGTTWDDQDNAAPEQVSDLIFFKSSVFILMILNHKFVVAGTGRNGGDGRREPAASFDRMSRKVLKS